MCPRGGILWRLFQSEGTSQGCSVQRWGEGCAHARVQAHLACTELLCEGQTPRSTADWKLSESSVLILTL